MSMRVRSKTGCLTCKNRRKKCDEKRPVCDRCTKAKMECLGYAHLDNPPERRSRSNRQRGLQLPTTGSTLSSPFPHATLPSSALISPASDSQNSGPLIDVGTLRYQAGTRTDATTDSAILGDPTELSLFPFMPVIPLPPQDTIDTQLWADADLFASNDPNQWFYDTFGTPNRSLEPGSLSNYINTGSIRGGDFDSNTAIQDQTLSFGLHPGQSASLEAFSTHDTHSPPTLAIPSDADHPALLESQNVDELSNDHDEDNVSTSSDDSDIESTQVSVYRALALDKTLVSNTVPFIIDNYAKWITRSVFDPLRLAHQAKDFLFRRLGRSENTRTVTILKANVLRSFIKNPASTVGRIPALPLLTNSVHGSIDAVNSKKASPDLDTEEILDAVGSIMELMYIHELSKPLSAVIRLIEASAPVYRRSRPEPPGEPVNLRLCLLHPDISIRHFPAMDILFSVRTGRPMCLRYETEKLPEPHENPPGDDDTGLRWMHGIPDQFLIMLAKINLLRGDFGTNVDQKIIGQLRVQVESFQPVTGSFQNPLMNVMETIIQESWRQAMYIYIFMGLAGAKSTDPCVTQPLKRFIKILKNAKSTRSQDLFLMLPMIVGGVAAVQPKDRELIRQRMLGLKECSQHGTCGSDSVQITTEVWAYCDSEIRPAVWMDLRLATLKVTGV